MGFPVVNTIQPLMGCDGHKAIPPPPPAPPPMTPHVVVWMSGLSQKIGIDLGGTKANSPESGVAKPVVAGYGYACARCHDSGAHLGHIWPNLLLPVIYLGSSAKHLFASSTVITPKGEIAVGVAWAVDVDLDCWDFPAPPLPTSVTVTAFNTVRAAFSLSDFAKGLVQMAVDMALSWAIGAAFHGIGKGLDRLFPRTATAAGSFFTRNAPGFFSRNGRLFVDSFGALGRAGRHGAPALARNAAEGIAKWALGGPVGASAPFSPMFDTQKLVDGWFE